MEYSYCILQNLPHECGRKALPHKRQEFCTAGRLNDHKTVITVMKGTVFRSCIKHVTHRCYSSYIKDSIHSAHIKNNITSFANLLRQSFFSPLVRHVSKCLFMCCWDTSTPHTGQSTVTQNQSRNTTLVTHLENVFCISKPASPCVFIAKRIEKRSRLRSFNSRVNTFKIQNKWQEECNMKINEAKLVKVCNSQTQWTGETL